MADGYVRSDLQNLSFGAGYAKGSTHARGSRRSTAPEVLARGALAGELTPQHSDARAQLQEQEAEDEELVSKIFGKQKQKPGAMLDIELGEVVDDDDEGDDVCVLVGLGDAHFVSAKVPSCTHAVAPRPFSVTRESLFRSGSRLGLRSRFQASLRLFPSPFRPVPAFAVL